MKKQKILIVIENGQVTEVYSTRKNSRFEILNRDVCKEMMTRVYEGKEDVDETGIGKVLTDFKQKEMTIISGALHKSKRGKDEITVKDTEKE